MKIYTKTGDDGTSSLYGGLRVPKTDARLEAYGTVDELNSFLGLTLCNLKSLEIKEVIQQVQNTLFNIGARLATPTEHLSKLKNLEQITDEDVKYLESKIDILENELRPINNFILPGGSIGSGYLHTARAICRRCERRIIAIDSEKNNLDIFIKYINRLSDFLFVAARFENKECNIPDTLWQK